MKYLLQLADNEIKFEIVDEHVFVNRKFAINDGKPRYSENYARIDGPNLEIHFKGNAQLLGGIARMLGANGNLGQYGEPTHIQFSRGRSIWIYEIATRQRWKKAA